MGTYVAAALEHRGIVWYASRWLVADTGPSSYARFDSCSTSSGQTRELVRCSCVG